MMAQGTGICQCTVMEEIPAEFLRDYKCWVKFYKLDYIS